MGTRCHCDVMVVTSCWREYFRGDFTAVRMHAYMIACLFDLTHSSGCQNEYLNITLGLY